MFGVVVLDESVPIRIKFLNHWQKCLLQYASVDNCICTYPSKMQIPDLPFLLIAAHTSTLVGSFSLGLYLGFSPDLVQQNLQMSPAGREGTVDQCRCK